jgi:hypothetical protein
VSWPNVLPTVCPNVPKWRRQTPLSCDCSTSVRERRLSGCRALARRAHDERCQNRKESGAESSTVLRHSWRAVLPASSLAGRRCRRLYRAHDREERDGRNGRDIRARRGIAEAAARDAAPARGRRPQGAGADALRRLGDQWPLLRFLARVPLESAQRSFDKSAAAQRSCATRRDFLDGITIVFGLRRRRMSKAAG